MANDLPNLRANRKATQLKKYDYTFVLRANDVLRTDPPGKYSPYYQRGHYRAETPLYAKVTKFISHHDLSWW